MTHRTLWYVFHPNFSESRGNKALLKAADSVDNVTVVHAYEEYGNFKIDVQREQDRLRNADLVVFQHPFYWYSSPALFKQWQDDVLTYGFAYPPKEGTELQGKHWLSVLTTGGPELAYVAGGFDNYSMSELLKPFQQTANLCGMRFHVPFIVHSVLPGDYEGIRSTSDEELAIRADQLAKRINAFDPAEMPSLEPNLPPHLPHPLSAQTP